MNINWQSGHFVANTAIERQTRVRAKRVLKIKAREGETPVAIERAIGRNAYESDWSVRQKIADGVKSKNAKAESRIDHVVLVTLNDCACLQQMPAAVVRQPIFKPENILSKPEIRRSLWAEPSGDAADVDTAEQALSRHERRESSARYSPRHFARYACG